MRDSLLIWGLLYESHYENKINKCHHQSDPVYNTLFSSSFFLNLAACWITACYRSSWFLFLFFTFFLEVKGGGCYLFPKSCNSACGFFFIIWSLWQLTALAVQLAESNPAVLEKLQRRQMISRAGAVKTKLAEFLVLSQLRPFYCP